jgi:hypothetical protein
MQWPEQQLSLVAFGMDTLARSKSGAIPSFKSIESSVTQMNHEQVVYNPEAMDDIVSETLSSRRFAMILLAVFACTALV